MRFALFTGLGRTTWDETYMTRMRVDEAKARDTVLGGGTEDVKDKPARLAEAKVG